MSNKSIIPSIPILLPSPEQNSVISDEQLLGIYNDILEDLRNDSKEVDAILSE